MLVLSRKSGERVLVGEDIEVVVLEVAGDRVKLGLKCALLRANLPGRNSSGVDGLPCWRGGRQVLAIFRLNRSHR